MDELHQTGGNSPDGVMVTPYPEMARRLRRRHLHSSKLLVEIEVDVQGGKAGQP
ncbi:hypothetical protein [Kitasatospora sp. NPDC091276]|uniref:hypothetical protein n=1 Tax=Kitasatospora sp. NPDC091276 TaxID=3155300 RepID=UPI003419BC85